MPTSQKSCSGAWGCPERARDHQPLRRAGHGLPRQAPLGSLQAQVKHQYGCPGLPFVEHLISTFSGLSSHPQNFLSCPLLIWPHQKHPLTWLGVHSQITRLLQPPNFPLDLQLLRSSPTRISTFTNIQSLLPKSDLCFHSHLDPKNQFRFVTFPFGVSST